MVATNADSVCAICGQPIVPMAGQPARNKGRWVHKHPLSVPTSLHLAFPKRQFGDAVTATIVPIGVEPVQTRPKVGDAVLVRWKDAHTKDGWEDVARIENQAADVTTVGILIAADRKAITVALCMAEGEAINGRITIPAGWIAERRTLARREEI